MCTAVGRLTAKYGNCTPLSELIENTRQDGKNQNPQSGWGQHLSSKKFIGAQSCSRFHSDGGTGAWLSSICRPLKKFDSLVNPLSMPVKYLTPKPQIPLLKLQLTKSIHVTICLAEGASVRQRKVSTSGLRRCNRPEGSQGMTDWIC